MKVYVFEIEGKRAHFSKHSEPNFTYITLPPTTAQGLLAAAFELNRDSYYELLSEKNLDLAIQNLSAYGDKTKPGEYSYEFITTNHIMLKTQNTRMKPPFEHTQVNMQYLVGDIKYRIFVKPLTEQTEKLLKNMKTTETGYVKSKFEPYFMGKMGCEAGLYYKGCFEEQIVPPNSKIHTAAVLSHSPQDFTKTLSDSFEKEVFVRSFTGNRERGAIIEAITTRLPSYTVYSSLVNDDRLFSINYNGEIINGCWL